MPPGWMCAGIDLAWLLVRNFQGVTDPLVPLLLQDVREGSF